VNRERSSPCAMIQETVQAWRRGYKPQHPGLRWNLVLRAIQFLFKQQSPFDRVGLVIYGASERQRERFQRSCDSRHFD